ncbi:carcinoembryonic antigen-related cell adhesion molecule 5-like isoform X2 [Takifugu rubripes]|uniref:carcinoembryonic antigen-related cell adhesion molecule 5-like isoform X2 n=1 Tax=Takifugu rubripes TaxID=31033 RepID=UPI00114606CD|nr:carcinoembryonic antigen-related cell adhesion molecule 5-like isoform X2 [Takifugu rubripes]
MSNSGKKSMEIALFCIIPVAFTGLIKGEGVLPHDSLNASVGMSVTFSTTLTAQEAPFSIINWKFNGTTIIYFNEVINTTPGYEGKVNISVDTGSLELRNLTVNDSGQYRVIIIPKQQSAQEGATTLNVYVPVSGVVVSNPDGDLVESNSSVRLSCSSSGSSLSFLWLNSSTGVTASDRVHTTDGGSTLVISNVTRYDQGPFRCHVSNPVSNGTSGPVDLTINYGPENTFVQPTNEYYETGSYITLNCSTISMPPALVNWFRNEVRLSETGPHLELNNVQENQSGNYSCQAFNNKTLRYDMSQMLALNILERIYNVSLVPSSTTPMEERSLNLTCDAGGSVFARLWSKDGVRFNLTDNMTLSSSSRVLTFTSLDKRDSGKYVCEVSNPIGTSDATYTLDVSYGPENIKIAGPDQIQVGQSLTMTCSTASKPLASYKWTLNETALSNSSEFSFVVQRSSDGGNYSCHAVNSVTGRTLSAVHAVSVAQKPDSGPACSGGCIAAISVSCVVLVGAAIGGCVYYRTQFHKKPEGKSGATTEREYQDNAAYSGSQELTYSNIAWSQNKDAATPQLELQKETQYAQIRANNCPPLPSEPPTYDVHMQRMQSRKLN